MLYKNKIIILQYIYNSFLWFSFKFYKNIIDEMSLEILMTIRLKYWFTKLIKLGFRRKF